jgi:DNA-directed RNA polymerase subunit M/transcription elongation factor TFIIS
MSTYPKVDTAQGILKKISYQGNKLSDKQINTLLKLKYKDGLLLTLKDRNFILEVVGLINTIGFEETVSHLKSNSKETVRFNLIKNSEPFKPSKQRFFLETTKDLRTVKIESYVRCKRCKEYQVDTFTKQMRSGDEGETTIYKCRNCGYGWRD